MEAAWRNVEVSGEGGKAETCQLGGRSPGRVTLSLSTLLRVRIGRDGSRGIHSGYITRVPAEFLVG